MPKLAFEKAVLILASVEEVFAFCNSRRGFEQHFPYKVIWYAGPETWRRSSELKFKFRYFGLWFDFQTKVTRWEKNRLFVDEMVVGPYKRFVHAHLFDDVQQGTVYTDHVEFETGFGRWVDRTIGMWMIRSTFAKRHNCLKRMLERDGNAA